MTTVLLTAARPGILARPRAVRRPSLIKRQRLGRRRAAPALRLSKGARAISTAFRLRVLDAIHEAARAQLGYLLRAATVSTWDMPGEPDSPVLFLRMTTKADRDEIGRVLTAVLEAVAGMAPSWSEEEKRDYGRTIYFDLGPR